MNQFPTSLLLILAGAYITHLLSKSYGRWREKKKYISEFSGLLKYTLPEVRQGVIGAYLFNSDLRKYLSVLKEYELKLGYKLLPTSVKYQIKDTSDILSEFIVEFRMLSNHIYTYYESMKNKVGQGDKKISTIVATRLICMDLKELPPEKVVINFPREMREHFSQVQCQPQQLVEIWDLGQKGNGNKFKNIRTIALDHIDKLDKMLSKLHRVW